MRTSRILLVAVLLGCLAAAGRGYAHVPYLESTDYSFERPMTLPAPIGKSRAFYSWFKTGQDVDVYAFEVTGPTRVYAQAIVPVCQGYEDVLPWFAVAGPGLPPPDEDLPFDLPEGYGAWVVKNKDPWTQREVFYEPFGGKWYFDGEIFDEEVTEPGTWYLYYWNSQGKPGDYVAIIGPAEIWDFSDILRALVYTPMIQRDEELHITCLVCPYVDSRVLGDEDGDQIGTICDNCPEEPNPDQIDEDGDGYGQACDCRDTDPEIHPNRLEIGGDGTDSNCYPESCAGGPVEPGSRCDNCFIATAAFGTSMAGKIDVLRAWRDRVLLKSETGRKFVELYYRCSPPFARFIASDEARKRVVRTMLLPLIGLVYLTI